MVLASDPLPDYIPCMLSLLRNLTLSVTILAIVTVALSVGYARGQMPVAGEIVICRGLHVVTIDVDANGAPTEARQTCPDALLLLAAPHAPPPMVVPAPATFVSVADIRVANDALLWSGPTVRARAPPGVA